MKSGDSKPLEDFLLNLAVSNIDEALHRFLLYAELIGEWNARINLTGAKSPQEILFHIMDCISAFFVNSIEVEKSFLDVGTGAGFPGIIWAILNSQTHIVGVEVNQKKIAFLHRIKVALNLTNFFILRKNFKEISMQDLPQGFSHGFSCVSRGTAKPQEILRMATRSTLPWNPWYVFSTEILHDEFLTLSTRYGMKVDKILYGPESRPDTTDSSRYLTVIRH